MRLILACRTAEWPVEAGRTLISLWPNAKKDALYELCPLRRKDAEEAAITLDCDPEAFLRAIWERSAVALATRPITLFFLLDEFRKEGRLSATHRQLYDRGTANLAREIDPARLELLRTLRKTEVVVSDEERLRAAQRLAALLLLSGRSAIRLSTGAFAEEHQHDLSLENAVGEAASPIKLHTFEEAVESALFTSLGERRFGFAHQTFAECLAAKHLQTLPLIQLRRLLCQRDARGEHVIPQLAELAAWLAGLHYEFREYLLRVEPEVLLRSDVALMEESLKSQLVGAILKGATDETIFDRRGFDRFFAGLNHPGLVDQLRPVIDDVNAGYIARRIAFDIVSHCRLSELSDDLLAVVKDARETQHLRDRAASALENVVPDERLEVFEPLARGEVGDDKDDNIRGYAMRRLVPARWKIRDALPFLTPRHNQNHIGAYHVFLEFEVPKFLEDADLIPVLRWLADHTGSFDSLSPRSKLAFRALSRAVELINVQPIAEALGDLWHQLGVNYMRDAVSDAKEVATVFAASREARRAFVSLCLHHPEFRRHDLYDLERMGFLADADDLHWLLDQLPIVEPEFRLPWVQAIVRLTWNPEVTTPCWDKLLQRISEVPELANEFAWLGEWRIDEPKARKAKADWLREKRRKRGLTRHQTRWARPDLRPKIVEALESARAGDKESWLHLCIICPATANAGKNTHGRQTYSSTPAGAH